MKGFSTILLILLVTKLLAQSALTHPAIQTNETISNTIMITHSNNVISIPSVAEISTNKKPQTLATSTNIIATNVQAKTSMLSNLIDHTLKHNRELQELKLDYQKSLLDIKKAEANRLPKANYDFSFTHIGNPMKPIYINPADFFTTPIPGVSTETVKVFDGMEDKYYRFKFTVDQPIFTWGKINNGIKITQLISKIKKLQIKEKEKELKTTVEVLVYSLHLLNEIEKILAKQQEISARLIYLSEKSYENGFLIYTDVLDAKIKVKELDVAIAKIYESKNQALLNLQHTTEMRHLTMKDLTVETLNLNAKNYKLSNKSNLIRQAFKNNLNIALLKQLKELAHLKFILAKGAAYLKPDIGARAEFTYGGSRFPFLEADWFGKDDYNINLSFALSANLMDGLKQETEIQLGKLDLTNANYHYQQGKDQLEQFISETLLKIQLNRENLEYFHLKIENDGEQIQSQKTQFEAGSGNETDYLKKQLDRFKDQIDYYKELIDYFKNYFTVLGSTR